MASIFAGQGIDASEAQFAFATYGEGTDAVTLTAMAVPGINDATLELISRSFSGGQGAGDAETLTIDGKSVLRVSGGAAAGWRVHVLRWWSGLHRRQPEPGPRRAAAGGASLTNARASRPSSSTRGPAARARIAFGARSTLARRALDADLHVTATRDAAELTAWLEERVERL